MSTLKAIFRRKTLSALLLIVGLGLAVHAAPVEKQSPCEPGLFAQIQAAVVPSAWADDVEEGCDGFCGGTGCYGLGDICRSCYDGDWTFCAKYPEPE